MSAFVLTESGFQQLACELEYHRNYNHAGLQWATERFLGNDKPALKVQQLYEANVQAVNALNLGSNGHVTEWSAVELLKHLECLSYQMAEGDVPESKIYQDLERLTGDIAKSIVGQSEDYGTAKWGW